MKTKIKICGVTNEKDVRFISMLDVDYIGFNFVKGTKRAVSESSAVKLAEIVPPYITPVAVVADPSLLDVKRISKKTGIKLFQFHGEEPVDFIRAVKETGIGIIKAFRPKNADETALAEDYLGECGYFLVDAYSKNQLGGTGKMVSRLVLKKMSAFEKPLFLSGGLNPENVAGLVAEIQPFAVDVSSGVEKTPRSKDIEKVRAFVRAVKVMGTVPITKK